MAQSSKSRIVIWTIVGILAVIAVVFVISSKKSSTSGRPPVNPERFAKRMESQFQKFEGQISDAKAANPGAPADQWQKISDNIARGRQVMARMAGLTDQNILQPQRDSVIKAYLDARKMYKGITGKDASGSSTGGN